MLPIRRNNYYSSFPSLRTSDSLLEKFLNDDFWNLSTVFTDEFPKLETDRYYDKDSGEYVISMSLPGFTKEDISVEIENDMLVIKGEIKNEKTKKFISQNKFSYSYSTNNLNVDTTNASMENGILEIRSKPVKELNVSKKIAIM
jgi:HSP20 family protein